MQKRFLGLDIGGTKCAVVLARLDGGVQIIDRVQFPTHGELGFAQTRDALYQAIDALLQRQGMGADGIEAIGISCGGPLDSRRGVILSPPNLPGWDEVPLPAMLTARYGVPAYLQNDANACALVEWKLGAGRGTRDMVFLTMGTGMGAGIIAEGQLLRGHNDMGGEVGHLRLTEDGPTGYGKSGSFEGYTSGGGIARQAQAMTRALCAAGTPPAWVRDGVPEEALDAKCMADYAAAGDVDAIALFEQVGDRLGQGISLLLDTLNPECVVIGSIFVRCEALLRPVMERAIAREALPHTRGGLRIVPAQAGEALGDLAAIMVALHARGIDPMVGASEQRADVQAHMDRLMTRYPVLAQQRDAIWAVYEAIRQAYQNGGKLLLCGNGGSCSDAQHIVGELMKGFWKTRPLPEAERAAIRALTEATEPGAAEQLQGALPAIVLSEHSTLGTAFANDVNPHLVFAQQVIGYGKPGDVFLGLSTSGNARNVLLAAQVARARGLRVLALAGGSTGGALGAFADAAIVVPGNNPADVQELHLPVYHALCGMLEDAFFGDPA